MADAPLVLCLPSKGSLSDGVVRLFEQCLIPVRRTRGARSYEAHIQGFDDVSVVLARATEIPSMLDAEQVHVGITGLDLVQEHLGEGASPIHIVMPDIGFGRADLVVGVPRTWLDVTTIADLVEVADDIRHLHGRPIRVATKFPNLTRGFFRGHGLTDYRIVESLGAIEAAPRGGQADVIVDLSSTGTSARCGSRPSSPTSPAASSGPTASPTTASSSRWAPPRARPGAATPTSSSTSAPPAQRSRPTA